MDYRETYTWKEINETPEIFDKIVVENHAVMQEIVSAIKESKFKTFVGAARGASNNALVYFKYLLGVMTNYTFSFSAPSILTLYHGKVNYAESVIIGCSQSGKAEDVLEVIKKGNEQGAITIAITNNPESPVAKEAKYHLDLVAGEKNSAISTKTYNAQNFMLLWLASELARHRDNLHYLKHLKHDIAQAIPEIDALTTKYAEKFKDMKRGFVLSRGLTYSIALETSLLLQQTGRIQMAGYATSEFYHGPLSLVEEDSPVMIFCAEIDGNEEVESIIRADQIKCVQKVLSMGAPVLLVTNDCILTNRFGRCNDALINCSVPEEFALFPFAIFAQMLACKIAVLKGNNPDAPRGIDKDIVTR